jgi:hypothetical protein
MAQRSTARRRVAPTWLKRVRAATLVAVIAAGAAWAWPRPAQADLAKGNGQALRYLVERYSSDHEGVACGDLGTLVAAAELGGYNMRVRNPYSGVVAPFDDPAIARPIALHHGDATEAGVVFYQAHPDALGRVAWVITVASEKGQLLPVMASAGAALTWCPTAEVAAR